MKGDELVKGIRSFEDGRGFIPIIAITEHNDDQRRISLYQQGVNDFLPKPILHEELLVRINNLITNNRHRQPPSPVPIPHNSDTSR